MALPKKLFIFITVLFLGCSFRFEKAWDYTFDIPDLGLETIEDVMLWTAKHVTFYDDSVIHGVDEYWQTPYQTYIWKTGDCEDFVILAMYLIYRDTGIVPQMVTGFDETVLSMHAWIRANHVYWDPQFGIRVPSYAEDYSDIESIRYDEVMWIAVNDPIR